MVGSGFCSRTSSENLNPDPENQNRSPGPPMPQRLSRRSLLKQATAATALAVLPLGRSQSAETSRSWHDATLNYLQSLAKKDGGFGWAGQPFSHLTPTHAAIGCYHLLKRLPPDSDRLTRFVRENHPKQWKGQLEQEHREFEFQQIQSLLWLDADPSGFRAQVAGWKEPVPYMQAYEKDRNPVFRFQLTAFTCRKLLGLPLEDIHPSFTDYLIARRRDNGSFNALPASDGSDGHVMNTLWGLQALEILGRSAEMKANTVAWLHDCQRRDGGFTYQPRPKFAGEVDLAYTWAAVKSLQILGAEPKDRQAAVRSVWSCWNHDGGFGDRPGWRSNAPATFYALDTLQTLGALDAPPPADHPTVSAPVLSLPPKLQVFSVLLEGHGTGSPADAVELARCLRIHLWGAKTSFAPTRTNGAGGTIRPSVAPWFPWWQFPHAIPSRPVLPKKASISVFAPPGPTQLRDSWLNPFPSSSPSPSTASR